jgi:AmmeMemoRadiSam system protein B/AmmeMemoRadiSam system protein A
MDRILLCWVFSILLFPVWGLQTEAATEYPSIVRPPVAAGRFYPAEPGKLSRAIHYYLEDAVHPAGKRPVAIVTPHAGYTYSGQISADAFKQAAGYDYDLVIVIGTNHCVAGFKGVSVFPKGGYQTPLGIAEIDEDAAAGLIGAEKEFTFLEAVHRREHSVEVQIPFIQTLFPDAKIVTAIIGSADSDLCRRFGRAVAKALQGRRGLIVASSDLSHYPLYEDAVQIDKATLEAMITLNPHAVRRVIEKQMKKGCDHLATCACGEAPILSAITAAKNLAATCGRILSYANSGDVTIGSRDHVVGYGAVAFFAENPDSDVKPAKRISSLPGEGLNTAGKTALLSFARKTIYQFLTSETVPLARGFDPFLENRRGVFVTLRKEGGLRGCIGHMADDLPLCQAVGAMALQAAFNDRRFRPVALKELPDIEIEISALTPCRMVESIKEIQVGRDGVLIEKNGRSAVFLPQVAVEQGWDRDQMLEHLSLKAGLPPGSWKEGAKFSTFQADVFRESGN